MAVQRQRRRRLQPRPLQRCADGRARGTTEDPPVRHCHHCGATKPSKGRFVKLVFPGACATRATCCAAASGCRVSRCARAARCASSRRAAAWPCRRQW